MNSSFPQESAKIINLPEPRTKGKMSLEETIEHRKSIRNYTAAPLTLAEAGQLLWAAGGQSCDGITGASRTYPSAGACYPLEIYLVAGNVKGLAPGLYRYQWQNNQLQLELAGDLRGALAKAAWGQSMIKQAPLSIVFTGIFTRTTSRYGERGERYIYMDMGHAGQNIYLQAQALGLGTVAVGAFQDEQVKNALKLPQKEEPLYIMPVGRVK